jgi:hypothetical protein
MSNDWSYQLAWSSFNPNLWLDPVDSTGAESRTGRNSSRNCGDNAFNNIPTLARFLRCLFTDLPLIARNLFHPRSKFFA